MMEVLAIITLILLLVAISVATHFLIKLRKAQVPLPVKKQPTWIQTTRYNRNLYELIFKLKDQLKADHICIARLHNGGYFNNEFPIRRFSAVMEAHNPDKTESMVDKYRDIHISKYPEVMHQLIFLKSYFCTDIQFCEDSKFKGDMIAMDYKSSFLFLIRQVDEERTPEAFIWINYQDVRQLTKEQRSDVWSKHNRILNYLNMTKEE
ncbi:MAG: hypothetical protein KAR19_03790 [Bacteroidales bacterium]|nr:hypothetical protein [Bacteroidales bacterium]